MEHQIVRALFDLFQQDNNLTLQQIATHLKTDPQQVSEWLSWLNTLDDVLIIKDDNVHLTSQYELIDPQVIQQQLADIQIKKLEILSSVSSTNTYLMKQSEIQSSPVICFAEHQVLGKGRRGKEWVSPFAKNIYFSLLFRSFIPKQQLGFISLLTGVSIAQAITAMDIQDIKVKWPNDIYYKDQKLAGVLIEVKEMQNDYTDLVIGVGVNVKMEARNALHIDQPWTSLSLINQGQTKSMLPSRSHIAGLLIENILKNLHEFESHGASSLLAAWESYDYLYGKSVQVSGGESLVGTAKGINERGELIVVVDEKPHTINSGEISVRLCTE